MGYRFVLQPNGLFGVFDKESHSFILLSRTKEEIVLHTLHPEWNTKEVYGHLKHLQETKDTDAWVLSLKEIIEHRGAEAAAEIQERIVGICKRCWPYRVDQKPTFAYYGRTQCRLFQRAI